MHNKYWPDDATLPLSTAHASDWNVTRFHPDRLVPWTAGHPPDLECGHNMYTQGRLRSCGYCGSMHPTDLAAAIRQGARPHWADFKYGWPHKAYIDGIPNPYAGQRCSTTSTGYGSKRGEGGDDDYIKRTGGEWVQLRSTMDDDKKDEFVNWPWHRVDVERPVRHEKFYSVHLQDASAEDRDTIEKALRTQFQFLPDGGTRWRGYQGDTPWGELPATSPEGTAP